MMFRSNALFFAAGIFYLIFLVACLLKKRGMLRGHAAFLCLYAGSVCWLSVFCFPFMTNSMNYRQGWSLLPFGNLFMILPVDTEYAKHLLVSLFRYFLLSFALAAVFGFCFCLLSRKRTFAATVLKTTALLAVLQAAGIWCMLLAHTLEHPFDTGVLLADVVGAAVGFFCFRLLEKSKQKAVTPA